MDINVSSYSSLQSIKCPNIDSVCGTSTRPFNCYWGHYNDNLTQCVCKAGYIGDECDVEDRNYTVSEAMTEISPSPTEDIVASFCFIGPSYQQSISGIYILDGEYEGYPTYTHYIDANNSRYIYYIRSYSYWGFSAIRGATSVNGYCYYYGVNDMAHISTCNFWYFWNGYSWINEAIIYNENGCPTTTPTYNPTIQPSISPSISPTTPNPTTPNPTTLNPTTLTPTTLNPTPLNATSMEPITSDPIQ